MNKPNTCKGCWCYASCKWYRATDKYPYYECTYFERNFDNENEEEEEEENNDQN